MKEQIPNPIARPIVVESVPTASPIGSVTAIKGSTVVTGSSPARRAARVGEPVDAMDWTFCAEFCK